jgi:hypothetical protein
MHNIVTNKHRLEDEPSKFQTESTAIDMISSTHQTPNDSIYLTFDLPVEAVERLRFLINRNENVFKELGVLSVQFDNDYPITIFEESEVLIDQTKSSLSNSLNDKNSISQMNNKIIFSNVIQPSIQQSSSQTTSSNTPIKKKTRKTISELTSYVNIATESVVNPTIQANISINHQAFHADDANNSLPNKILQKSSDLNDSKINQKKKKRSVKLNDVTSGLAAGIDMAIEEKETKNEYNLPDNPILNSFNKTSVHMTPSQFTMPSPMLATLLNNKTNNSAVINEKSNLDLQNAQSDLNIGIADKAPSISMENKANETNDLMKSDEYKHIYQIRQLLANQAALQQTRDQKDSTNKIIVESAASLEGSQTLSVTNKRVRIESSDFEPCENSKRIKIEEQNSDTDPNNFAPNESVTLKTTEQQIDLGSYKNLNPIEKDETSQDKSLCKIQFFSSDEKKNGDLGQTNNVANVSNETISCNLNSANLISSSFDLNTTNSSNQSCDSMRTLPLNIFDNVTNTSASPFENKPFEQALADENNTKNG